MNSLSMNENIFFKFIGSKWFSLVLGIVMCALLPVTYGNFMVVYDAGQIGQFWYIPAILLINIITIIMAFYKFTSNFVGNKQQDSEEW